MILSLFDSYHIQTNVPLAHYTTVKIGGPAEFFAEPKTAEEFVGLVKRAIAQHVPITVLGRGANVLIADDGIRGLVIHPRNATYEFLADGVVRVGAGMDLGALAHKLADDGFAGSDQLIGVPGTVGGAVYGNAGKGEAGIGEFVQRVLVVDRASGEEQWIEHEQCGFAHRRSNFQINNRIIIAADCLFPRDTDGRAKENLRNYLLRKTKTQPLHEATWGCTFRNVPFSPQVGNEHVRQLISQELAHAATQEAESARRFVFLINERKLLPASWLLDKARCKGLQVGNAVVSDRHANFIINKGGATARDARALIEQMRQRVQEEFGIVLEEEVRYLS